MDPSEAIRQKKIMEHQFLHEEIEESKNKGKELYLEVLKLEKEISFIAENIVNLTEQTTQLKNEIKMIENPT
tara:strand:+ start:358 stop:573 length:216 start_codon:yes stop_codon:yes gene_type:complete